MSGTISIFIAGVVVHESKEARGGFYFSCYAIEIAKVQIVSIGFTFCALLKRPKALVSDSVTDSSRCLRNVLRPKSDFGSINSMLLRSLRSETSDAIRKLRRLKTQPEIYILALAFRVSN
jgi:hypothetical protein